MGTGDGRANPDAGVARLGNRHLADTLLAEPLQQAAGDTEQAADVADVLAHDEDGRVALHLLVQGLVERFDHVELPNVGIGRRVARLAIALRLGGQEHVGQGFLRRRIRTGDGEIGRFLGQVGFLFAQFIQLGSGEYAGVEQLRAEDFDGVAALPEGHFVGCAGVFRRKGGVGVEAIGLGLDQGRAAAGPGAVNCLLGRRVHGEAVLTVHNDARQAKALGPGGHVRYGERGLDRGGQGPLVVLADEDDGQLGDGGDVERLQHDALASGAVAEEADADAVLALQSRRQGRAGGDRRIGPDYGIGAQHPEGQAGHVHGAALALAVAVAATE